MQDLSLCAFITRSYDTMGTKNVMCLINYKKRRAEKQTRK